LPAIYADPFTGQEFDLIIVNGEIRGVKSRSTDAPLDKVRFKDAGSYRQITFQAVPPSAAGQPCGPQANPIQPLNPLAPGGCPSSNPTDPASP
jgi:hypothetical protein